MGICLKKLKELKKVDCIIIGAVLFVILIGLLAFAGKNKFSKSPVVATKKVAFQVLLRSVSITDDFSPFRIGDDAFITIRNVPYTKLQIIDSQIFPKKVMIPSSSNKNGFVVTDDKTQPFLFDAVVTLIDDAKITADGAVVGGNKIKIGLPIVLEGYNYRVGGTISNVQELTDFDVISIYQFVSKYKASQAPQAAQNETEKTKDVKKSAKKADK